MSTDEIPATGQSRHRAPIRERGPRWGLIAAALGSVGVLAAAGGFFLVMPRMGPHQESVPAPNPPAALAPSPPPAAPPPTSPTLTASFGELQDSVGAEVGIAFAPLDRPEAVQVLGSWTSGPAWSTIKVPLSIALLRQDGTGSATVDMQAAITASDNAAAQAIWEQLGAHQTAADKVDEVLAQAGDLTTQVQPEVTRSGFSAFGQTEWSLSDQVRFLAHAACDADDAPVLDLMGDISSGQRWGLGTLDGARFKGGWGPGTDGLYLLRQLGVVTGDEGDTVVAVAAVAGSGGFGDGTAVLTQMASWVGEHLGDMHGGRCAAR
jgi:hypothetical protein